MQCACAHHVHPCPHALLLPCLLLSSAVPNSSLVLVLALSLCRCLAFSCSLNTHICFTLLILVSPSLLFSFYLCSLCLLFHFFLALACLFWLLLALALVPLLSVSCSISDSSGCLGWGPSARELRPVHLFGHKYWKIHAS